MRYILCYNSPLNAPNPNIQKKEKKKPSCNFSKTYLLFFYWIFNEKRII